MPAARLAMWLLLPGFLFVHTAVFAQNARSPVGIGERR